MSERTQPDLSFLNIAVHQSTHFDHFKGAHASIPKLTLTIKYKNLNEGDLLFILIRVRVQGQSKKSNINDCDMQPVEQCIFNIL